MSEGDTKITVKVYEPLMRHFDDQLRELHIKRDAFLAAMLARETEGLAQELKGKRLSSRAKRYIAGELKRLGPVTVNVVVPQQTALALNKVVEECNLVRDAFVNRLILFLRSSDQLLEYLGLPKYVTGTEFERVWVQPMPTSPLRALEAVHGDPMYYLRAGASERFGCGLYLLELPPKFNGFACFLEDYEVPGTEAHEQFQKADLLSLLEEFEESALTRSPTTPGGTS